MPKPTHVVVGLWPDSERFEVFPWAQVRVELATGQTSPPDVRLPPPGWRTGLGEIGPGMGPEPCGLGGRHRWVLEAISVTQSRGQAGEQLALGAS